MSFDVAIRKCSDYDNKNVYRAVKDAVDLVGGMGEFVKKGERILLKPNLLAPKTVSHAVTTNPSIVRAVVGLVREAGAVPVVGDSPALSTAAKVAAKCGIMDVLKDLDVELVELSTPVEVDNPGAVTFRRLELAKEALEVDGIINLPKLKTHAQMFMTMGVKNIFGCVAGKRKAQWHLTAGVDTDYFAEMLLDLYLFMRPRLTIMDAIISMEGNGPAGGDARETKFVAAASEAIALDRVMVEIVGTRVEDVPVMKMAKKRELPCTDLSNINVLGEDLSDLQVRDFKFPPLISANLTAFLPKVMDRHLRKAMTSRPVIDPDRCKRCDLCARICPADKIEDKGKMIIDPDGCIRCYCCQEICPWGAITVKEGWLKKIIPGL